MKIITLLSAIFILQFVQAQTALNIPPTQSGTTINLTLQNGTQQFYAGTTTTTMGANGNILGPTLILNHGDFVNFSVKNQIADTTTIHWHGLHVAAENDGGPHTPIYPNTTWTPSFEILDKASTYWYHPHLHHYTDKHVSKGIAGLIIVKDSIEAKLILPRTYGIDDFPLIIQTKDFDANNQIVVHSNSDDVILVNATIDPFLNVPAQVVRYRILNGSSQRAFNFGLSNNKKFHQIASDGGLLSSSVQLSRLLLAPGERAEILIDFTGMKNQSVILKSYASELPNGIYGAKNPGMGAGMTMTGYNPNSLNGSDFDIINFNVGAQTTSPITTIPTNLVTVTPILESTSKITRKLSFTPVTMGPNQLNGNFLINGVSLDMKVINYTIPFNNTEIWELRNQSAISHPFHIHDVQFYILTRNGTLPPANERGRKDVVLVKPQETVRFIAQFTTFTNDTVPYMYHCHLLTHEDKGMMGQFVVSTPLSVAERLERKYDITVYPNPNNGEVTITMDKKIEHINVYDMLGKKINSNITYRDASVFIGGLPKGMHFIRIETNEETILKKILVN